MQPNGSLVSTVGAAPSNRNKPGNVPYALCIGTMTGVTGRDIGFRYSLHVDRASRRRPRLPSLAGLGGKGRKIIGEITRGLRAERSDRTPGVIGGIQINYGSRPLVCTGLLYARLMLAFRWILFQQSEGRDDDVFSTLRIDVGSR